MSLDSPNMVVDATEFYRMCYVVYQDPDKYGDGHIVPPPSDTPLLDLDESEIEAIFNACDPGQLSVVPFPHMKRALSKLADSIELGNEVVGELDEVHPAIIKWWEYAPDDPSLWVSLDKVREAQGWGQGG